MDNTATGRHLLVTGFFHPDFREKANDEVYLSTLLNRLIKEVKMEILKPAQMVTVDLSPEDASSPKDCGGVTGFTVGHAILSTSHVSIHTWPLHDRLSFDLYSCKDFDPHKVVSVLQDQLGLTGGVIHDVDRTPHPELKNELRYIKVKS